ncbi:hypothetical protein J2W22_002582 [Sphingomonas kyeonggiensis]|uniref:hypothetical protein n=1 Tax=Sphingomonas kyeonggiensis TaxID=1268553 RepID=UPI0027817BE3|nr:hypothetical protein [Sphingomonas kyeonggiensis]MDQ0250518.1 hypothetical protein [Sphingomonas kyeonggiensis]
MLLFRSLLVPVLMLAAAQANAQEAAPALPDPATVEVPDVTPSTDPKVREEGYKFYYFHSPDVSFAEAYQDLKECRAYLPMSGPVKVPGFIPWDETQRRRTIESPGMFGLVGYAIGALIQPKLERGVRSNKMRRCMGTRGYVRYAIPEATWEKLNDDKDEGALILKQAKLASGPAPKDEVVTK